MPSLVGLAASSGLAAAVTAASASALIAAARRPVSAGPASKPDVPPGGEPATRRQRAVSGTPRKHREPFEAPSHPAAPSTHREPAGAVVAYTCFATGLGMVALGLAGLAAAAVLGLDLTWLALIVAGTALFGSVPFGNGLLRVTGPVLSAGLRLRMLVDALIIGSSLVYVLWILVIAPKDLLAEGVVRPLIGAGVPVVVTAGLAGLVLAVIAARPDLRRGIRLLGAATVLLVATVAAVGVAIAFAVGYAPVVVLVTGLSAVVLAITGRLYRVVPGPVMRPPVALSLTLGAIFVDCATALFEVLREGHLELGSVIIACLVALALATRQLLFAVDERRYSQRLAENEAHFRAMAHTDPLTGLANRRELLRILHEEAVGGPPCVLVGIDLDGFKNVNDMRGHDLGDAVLVEVGRRLRENLRRGDVAARLGGDEFAVLIWAKPEVAYPVAQRILAALGRPFELPQGTLFMTASLGLAGCATANDVETLLRNADVAMRFAKQRGKDRLERYDAAYDDWLRRRMLVEQELRQAIERNELSLAFQPVVTLPGQRTVGVEALLRWHHPELGSVSPQEFVSVAEESGLIGALGGWVLDAACRQLAAWLDDGHDLWVSINVSVRELHEPEYADRLLAAVAAHRVPADRLVLEVTEHAVALDLDELVGRLHQLREIGVRIALDDFGAGYSSLGQLRRLPVDVLKIDRALVADAATEPLVDVVARLGRRLGLQVIAEGVETEEQRVVVEEAACGLGQGYLFGYAVPPAEVATLLSAQRVVTPLSA